LGSVTSHWEAGDAADVVDAGMAPLRNTRLPLLNRAQKAARAVPAPLWDAFIVDSLGDSVAQPRATALQREL